LHACLASASCPPTHSTTVSTFSWSSTRTRSASPVTVIR
jgi:hypothetical protein